MAPTPDEIVEAKHIVDTRKVEDDARKADEEARRLEKEQQVVLGATLHAEVVVMPNIKAMVPLTLDLASPHYSRWRSLFLNTVGKYDLFDDDFANDPHWRWMHFTVKSWLFGTISPEFHEIVHMTVPTSRAVWLALENQFIGNKETRALLLDVKPRTFI